MRTMLRITMPVETANKAIKDGSLARTFETMTAELNPEASYFYPENGRRAAIFVFDMTDSSQIPSVAEPFFLNLDATVELYPVMNADDLKKGLEKAMKSAAVQ